MPRHHSIKPSPSSWFGQRMLKIAFYLLSISFLISGCGQRSLSSSTPLVPIQTINSRIGSSPTPTASPRATLVPHPSPSPTQSPVKVWIPGYLPSELHAVMLPSGFTPAPDAAAADVILQVRRGDAGEEVQWIYALVAPFPTVTDEVTADELRGVWEGQMASPINSPLLMDESTRQVLSAYWGPPSTQAVEVLPANDLINRAWSDRPSWAIIPFNELAPRWKVLSVDGQSPIHKDFDPSSYALTLPFTLSSRLNLQPADLGLPTTNRDASRLTVVAMTGVTAMVRATAYTMELRGITYPAGDIGSLLADADITHISNEIPFSTRCPEPTPVMSSLVFCSNPRYIDLLKAVGTDVIELTGDHFMDYGVADTLFTLGMYKDLGWPYYGGGANAEDARQPVLFENNGNRIAFMGCNIGCQVKTEIPCDAIATEDHPGAAQCDFDYISSEITSLKEDGYQVIFTFQHREYYTYTTEPILAEDFGRVAADGATIVSGSQAHQPHGFAFQDSSFIHYGLGNLFFDQYHYCGNYACDNAFIDEHIFYAGEYISTELLPIHFVDFARPHLMTEAERADFLELLFRYSGW